MKTTTENGKNVVGDTTRREEQLQWLGGFFCGEGCITLYWRTKKEDELGGERKQLCLQAQVVNTDKILIEKAESILRENDLKPITYWTTSGRNRPLGVVKIVGNNKLRRFLTLILPYLFGTKSEVAKMMLRLIEYRLSLPHGNQWTGKIINNEVLDDMIKKIKLLNHAPLNDYTPHTLNG